jgi:hypothetical protein
MAPAVPYYLTPCWFTLDPASLLVTSHYHEGLPEIPPEWLAHEYFGDDFHTMADVARSAHGVSTLHEATGGDPSRSLAWRHYIHPFGGEQQLLAALRTPDGAAWGILGLYRETGAREFTPEETGSCGTWRRASPRAPNGDCSSARRQRRRARTPPGSWC